jgi:hypothetical protein
MRLRRFLTTEPTIFPFVRIEGYDCTLAQSSLISPRPAHFNSFYSTVLLAPHEKVLLRNGLAELPPCSHF